MAAKPDFTVENHGTIFLVFPQHKIARDYLERNCDENQQWFGTALAVEHGYIVDLVAALKEDRWRVRA